MAKAISIDLRERLTSAVESGMTRRAAAKRFCMAASTAIKRVGRSVSPDRCCRRAHR